MLGLGTGKGGQSSNQQVQGQQMPNMGGGGLAALFANNAPTSGGGGMATPMPQIMAPQRPQIQMPMGRPMPQAVAPQAGPMSPIEMFRNMAKHQQSMSGHERFKQSRSLGGGR